MFLFQFEYKRFLKGLYERAFEEDLFNVAAQVAFYFSFAIFPLLLFFISLVGLILSSTEDLKGELYYYLSRVMPISAFDLVKKTIDELMENSTAGKLTLGFFIALWSASAGVDSIRSALNSLFRLKETRSLWTTKFMSLSFTFIITILFSVVLAIEFYGWKLISMIIVSLSLPVPPHYLLILIQWFIIIGVLLFVFDLLYNFIPKHTPFRWVWITPGAIIGIILWLTLSTGLRIYLNYFNTYSMMYGSLGAVIILMLWLYLTSLVILIGGLINAVLEDLKKAKLITDAVTAETVPEAESDD